jgi:hypothetical protein
MRRAAKSRPLRYWEPNPADAYVEVAPGVHVNADIVKLLLPDLRPGERVVVEVKVVTR